METIPSTDYIELIGQDDNDVFNGLGIDDSSTGGTYTLKLLEKVGNNFVIPDESKFKFRDMSVDFIIDGGEVV